MKVLGIDPGITGAFVLLEDGKPVFRAVMPIIKVKKGKGTKSEYVESEIVKIIKHCSPDHVFIEKQQAMPGQGGVSMFSIGLGYGILRGAIAGCSVPFTLLHAKTWQKEIFRDMPKEDTKANAALVCGRLWPEVDWRLTDRCKNWHDGACDAACIARYGWLHMGDNVVLFPVEEGVKNGPLPAHQGV